MAKGWILLHRQIFDNWIWSDGKFDKAHAWLDLLLLANTKTEKKMYRNNLKVFRRGEVNLSIDFLAKRWGWNWRTVDRFLENLQKDDMILVKKCRGGYTTITIVNYGKFQPRGKKSTDQNTDQNTNESTNENTDILTIRNNNKQLKKALPPFRVKREAQKKKKETPTGCIPGILDIIRTGCIQGMRIIQILIGIIYLSKTGGMLSELLSV